MAQTEAPQPHSGARISLQTQAACLAGGSLLYGSLGFSLGWYYTFTYYGKTGLPMPHPESCAVILLYYFSVLNVETELQAIHWMIVFPLSGAIWVWALTVTARRLGMQPPPLVRLYWIMGLACVPMVLPAPFMAFLAGLNEDGYSAERMLRVALRRANRSPDAWLTPLYFGLGLVSLALQWIACRKAFGNSRWITARHFLFAAIVLFLVSMATGLAVSYPLRYGLE